MLIGIILVTVVVWVVDGSAPTKVAELPQLHYGVWKVRPHYSGCRPVPAYQS